MTEVLSGSSERSAGEDYRAEVFEYFSCSMKPEEVEWYEQSGLVPTNNLHLWFQDDPKPWLIEGVARNPHDYHWREFGPVMDAFRIEFPELWESVIAAAEKRREAMRSFNSPQKILAMSEEELARTAVEDKVSIRHFETIKNKAFDKLAPMLIKAGIHPLDVCK